MFKNFLITSIILTINAWASDDWEVEQKAKEETARIIKKEYKANLKRLETKKSHDRCLNFLFYEVRPAQKYKGSEGSDYVRKIPPVKMYDESFGKITIAAQEYTHGVSLLRKKGDQYVSVRSCSYSHNRFYDSYLSYQDSDNILVIKDPEMKGLYKIYEHDTNDNVSFYALDLGYFKERPELTPCMFTYTPPRSVDLDKLNNMKQLVKDIFLNEQADIVFDRKTIKLKFNKIAYNRHATVAVLEKDESQKKKEKFYYFYCANKPHHDFRVLCDFEKLKKNISFDTSYGHEESPLINFEPTDSLSFEELH